MPHYQVRGTIPQKRHITFKKEDGTLYAEEVVSSEGFADIYSIVYHHYPPTQVLEIGEPYSVAPEVAVNENMKNRVFHGFSVKPKNDYLESRTTILLNDDVYLSLASPLHGTKGYFFKNAFHHEMIFIHRGSGILTTVFGELSFKQGDHLIIPKATIYTIDFDTEETKLFIVESSQPFRFPKRYVNREGQLLEHAPFHERDLRPPEALKTYNESGRFKILIKRDDKIFPYIYATHPFDAIGWDGHLYPYAFSIYDFEPITGRLHMPPPIHQTFETPAFVTCAFVPRLYDYHPMSIPAPYHHSNVDSDEVLYYVDGDFMSRNNIKPGQLTLHPMGIPHGPQPNAIERSIGKKETKEYAVMVDTFKPLKLTKAAMEIEDKDYYKSWIQL